MNGHLRFLLDHLGGSVMGDCAGGNMEGGDNMKQVRGDEDIIPSGKSFLMVAIASRLKGGLIESLRLTESLDQQNCHLLEQSRAGICQKCWH